MVNLSSVCCEKAAPVRTMIARPPSLCATVINSSATGFASAKTSHIPGRLLAAVRRGKGSQRVSNNQSASRRSTIPGVNPFWRFA